MKILSYTSKNWIHIPDADNVEVGKVLLFLVQTFTATSKVCFNRGPLLEEIAMSSDRKWRWWGCEDDSDDDMNKEDKFWMVMMWPGWWLKSFETNWSRQHPKNQWHQESLKEQKALKKGWKQKENAKNWLSGKQYVTSRPWARSKIGFRKKLSKW